MDEERVASLSRRVLREFVNGIRADEPSLHGSLDHLMRRFATGSPDREDLVPEAERVLGRALSQAHCQESSEAMRQAIRVLLETGRCAARALEESSGDLLAIAQRVAARLREDRDAFWARRSTGANSG